MTGNKRANYERLFASLIAVLLLLSTLPSTVLLADSSVTMIISSDGETPSDSVAKNDEDKGDTTADDDTGTENDGDDVDTEQEEEKTTIILDTLAVEDEADWLGEGTEESPWAIYTAEDMLQLADRIIEGNNYLGKYFILMNDIDLSSVCGDGIGNWRIVDYNQNKPFSGYFDGGDHTVSGLYWKNSATFRGVGLFSRVENAEIKNLTVSGEISNATTTCIYIGGIAGRASSSTFTNCISEVSINTGDASTNNSVGGIVGYGREVTITNCTNKGNIYAQDTTGGIIGQIDPSPGAISAIIENCSNYSNITTRGGSGTGGIVGTTNSSLFRIECCYNEGKIESGGQTGGVLGNSTQSSTSSTLGTVELRNCVNKGSVSSYSTVNVGGIVAVAYPFFIITDCVNYGDISNERTAGGIVGNINGGNVANLFGGRMENCANYGTVSGDRTTGGLIGYLQIASASLDYSYTVSGCYNVGDVFGVDAGSTTDSIGGLIGYLNFYGSTGYALNLTVENCWNTGNVTAPLMSKVGGLFGSLAIGNASNLTTTILRNLYNAGYVSGKEQAGGVAGTLSSYGAMLHNVYSAASAVSVGPGGSVGAGIGEITTFSAEKSLITNVFAREYSGLPGIGNWPEGTTVDFNDVMLLTGARMLDIGEFLVQIGGAFTLFSPELFTTDDDDTFEGIWDARYDEYLPLYGDYPYPVLLPLLGLAPAETCNVKFSGARYTDVVANNILTYATTVAPGGDVAFTVDIKDVYADDDLELVGVFMGGTELTPDGDGVYTITGVNADTTVFIVTKGEPFDEETDISTHEYEVTFDVRDIDKTRIEEAVIIVTDVEGETQDTDWEGVYHLIAGVYSVRVEKEKEGYHSVEGTFEVSSNKNISVNLYKGAWGTLSLYTHNTSFNTDVYNGNILLQTLESRSIDGISYSDFELLLPEGIYTYTTRGIGVYAGSNMGSGPLAIEGSTEMYLRRVDFSTGFTSDIGYTICVKDRNGVEYYPGSSDVRAGGSARGWFVLPAERYGAEYQYEVVPSNSSYFGSYGTLYLYSSGTWNKVMNGTGLSDNGKILIKQKRTLTVTVPSEVEAADGYFHLYHRLHFYQPLAEIIPKAIDNNDATVTYTYDVPYAANGSVRLHYEVKLPGYVKQARVVRPRGDMSLAISIADLTIDTSIELPDDDKAANIIMTAPDSKHIRLDVGEMFELYCFRDWQAIDSGTGNYYVDPDFHIEVIAGNSVEVVDPYYAGAFLKGVEPGTSFVRVTYDALDWLNTSGQSKLYSKMYERNTVVLAVTVGGGGLSYEATGISLRETDTLYYARSANGAPLAAAAQYAEYTFKPTAGASVAVHAPVGSADAWDDEWTAVPANGDGSYTLRLAEGRSMVRVSTGAGEAYHAIHAIPVDVSVAGASGVVSLDGGKIQIGADANDAIKVSFAGLEMPFPKLGAIYNPGFPDKTYLVYTLESGLFSTPRIMESLHSQYDISTVNTITLTFSDGPGIYALTNGGIHTTSIGSEGGLHRNMTRGGMTQGAGITGNAPEYDLGLFGALPEIIFEVSGAPDVGEPHTVTITGPDSPGLTSLAVRNALGYIRAPISVSGNVYTYSLVDSEGSETYTYYAERAGYVTKVGTFDVKATDSSVSVDLTSGWAPIAQSGTVTLDVAGEGSIPAAGARFTIPAVPEDLAVQGYVRYNHGGYTALHALIDALGESNTPFDCTYGNLTIGTGAGGWVCLINGAVVSSPSAALVDGGDEIVYYYEAAPGAKYVRFERNTITVTQGNAAQLQLIAYENGELAPYKPAGGEVIVLNGEAIPGATVGADGAVTVPASLLSLPGVYIATVALPGGGGPLTYNRAAITVQPRTGGEEEEEETATVYFRLIGDTLHGEKYDDIDGVDGHGKYVTWIPTTAYTFKGTSVGMHELFMKAINDWGLAQRGADGNYVSAIRAPEVLGGFWLAEFDNGPNSGWMYTVNGVHPNRGLLEWEVMDGDSVVWHYVDDYTRETSFEGSQADYAFRWLEAPDCEPTAADIPKATEDNKEAAAPAATGGGGGGGGAAGLATIGNALVPLTNFDFNIWRNPFADVAANAWYVQSVAYVQARGLMTGVAAGRFGPEVNLTRGMLVAILHRLEGSPELAGVAFSDVAAGAWYAAPVAWASANGIVSGYGNGLFGPNDSITREQFVAMVRNYAKWKGLALAGPADLSKYEDVGEVSEWAQESMAWAVAEGLVSGRTETTLVPKGTTTRAETAAILERFLGKFEAKPEDDRVANEREIAGPEENGQGE